MTIRFAAKLALVCMAAVLQMPARSAAEITSVGVKESGLLGTYGERLYTWATADLEGTVSRDDGTTGSYRVPISLVYPSDGGNGFGFVDVVNNAEFAQYSDENSPLRRRAVSHSGQHILGDFLWTEGFTYIAVQWSRLATDQLGPEYGVIENGIDGYEIIKDAARLLRSLDHFTRQFAGEPETVDFVIGHGTSGSASVLGALVSLGDNREEDGSPVFDGLLNTAEDGDSCRFLTNDETPQNLPGRPVIALFYRSGDCAVPMPDDGKIILIRTQSEVEGEDEILPRPDLPHYRVYEVAGVSHIPEPHKSLKSVGASRQNPAHWQSVAKAMLRHLVAWIDTGQEPPPPLYIEGAMGPDGAFHMATDDDGNALGGIRLPHMPTVLGNGDPAGAPLGIYGGIDETLDRALGFGFANLGGTFERFSPEELADRYPTRDVYVDLVRKAAGALLEGGYILEEDHDAYIRAAEMERW